MKTKSIKRDVRVSIRKRNDPRFLILRPFSPSFSFQKTPYTHYIIEDEVNTAALNEAFLSSFNPSLKREENAPVLARAGLVFLIKTHVPAEKLRDEYGCEELSPSDALLNFVSRHVHEFLDGKECAA